ncbi:MAG: hypothetical protein RLZZ416_297 [Candidatus Parcubacteria bacterium]|jgi:hypothetical protein
MITEIGCTKQHHQDPMDAKHARHMALAGYVHNLPDFAVEILA